MRVIKEGILRKELPICHKRKGKFSLEILHELYKNPNDNVNEMQKALDDKDLGVAFKKILKDRLEHKCITFLDWQLA